jgi:hypothetical protein
MSDEARPAFYALAPGSWRDYVTLLHPPYTAWHLSYVGIGASLAPQMNWTILGLTAVAFFLGMGVAAHSLDELHSRPLGTRIASRTLATLAVASLAGAAAIGTTVAVSRTLWLLAFVAAGVFIAVAYNLELFGGLFHGDIWFGLAWGGFPLLTAFFAIAEKVRVEALVAAGFAVLLSLGQRALSSQVRQIRRRATFVSGTIVYRDGQRVRLSVETLTSGSERALKLIGAAAVVLAAALLLHRAS